LSEAEGKSRSGRDAELVAEKALHSRGYKIVDLNYLTPMGEIDLVAIDGKTVVFVEVRGRSSEEYGSPSASVTRRKQARVVRAARAYAARRHLEGAEMRFDVVGVKWPERAGEPEVEITKGAFDSAV